MSDGTGHAEGMLGIPGVVVLEMEEQPGDVVITS